MICACVPALNVFFVNFTAPKGIFARFGKHKDDLQGLPEDVDAIRGTEPNEVRTLDSSTFTREESSKFAGA